MVAIGNLAVTGVSYYFFGISSFHVYVFLLLLGNRVRCTSFCTICSSPHIPLMPCNCSMLRHDLSDFKLLINTVLGFPLVFYPNVAHFQI